MPNSSKSGSGSSSSSTASSGKTAKAKKADKKAEALRRRANAASIRNNVTAKYGKGKLAKETRDQIQAKLKKIREDEALATDEREEKEAELFRKVDKKLKEAEKAAAAEKAAKNAEKAAKKEAAKSARSAATARRRLQREANMAQAKANLKNYLGESPLKKHVNALYKARQNKNTKNMTAKNYAKASGLHRTSKLSESQRKIMKKQKSVAADFIAKGVDGEEFCEQSSIYLAKKKWLETKHKEKGLKHSLSTIISMCDTEPIDTPNSSGSA